MFRITQGDVTLTPIAKLPEGLELVELKDKVVQPSETHGKFHRFAADANVTVLDAQIPNPENTITPDTRKFVVVGSDGAVMFHGKKFDLAPSTETDTDHYALAVPPGTYEVGIALEYDYDRMEEARVVD